MTLKDQIKTDTVTAMKAREKEKVDALRLLTTAMQMMEIARTDPKNADYGKPVTDADYISVVEKQIKQRRDSIEQFEKGGRTDLAEKEKGELDIMSAYLPQQLTREEIAAAVAPIIEREGRDFKKVMPIASKELKGKAEGRIVQEVVRELTA